MYDQFDESNKEFFSHFFQESDNLFERPEERAEAIDDEVRFSIHDVIEIVKSIISNKNIIALRPAEINVLRDLATRLEAEKKISGREALALLAIAGRARPDGGVILSKIDELRKKLST